MDASPCSLSDIDVYLFPMFNTRQGTSIAKIKKSMKINIIVCCKNIILSMDGAERALIQ